MRRLVLGFLLILTGCSQGEPPALALDDIAEDYVHLVLEIGAHEEGYIDAYFGPPEWMEEARSNPRTTEELKRDAEQIHAALAAMDVSVLDPDEHHRVVWLLSNVESARFRLDMIEGARLPFREEAARLFGLTPDIRPLESYDPVIARISALLPGEAPLATRVEEFRERYTIPEDRLEEVMDAAISECRRRTLAHLRLPENERFEMEFVTGESWSAYNWYQGDNHSLIQINVDLPVRIGDALRLGCHEGYPGHHVQGIYLEQKYRERGWIEFSVMPLFAPAGPLMEGGANFGIDLAFPDAERRDFEMTSLYPPAGLDPAGAESFDALRVALKELAGAGLTVAAMYLDGEIDRDRAVELTQQYQLMSPARAERSVAFAETYRSYVINYSSGEDLVSDFVMRSSSSAPEQWQTYERIFSDALLPKELTR